MDVIVTKLSKKGEGIALSQDREIFIPQVLVGEKLNVEVGEPFAVGSARCPGKVISIIEPSIERNDKIACPYYGTCGGCQLMHMKDSAQIELKRSDIKEALEQVALKLKKSPKAVSLDFLKLNIAMVSNEIDDQVVRFKSIRYFGEQDNKLIQGFYIARSHKVVAIDSCCQEPRSFGPLACSLTATLNELKAPLSSATSSSSWGVKALQLRQGEHQDNLTVLLIVTGKVPESVKASLQSWAQAQHISSCYLGYNNQTGNSLYCEQVELIWGERFIIKNINGLNFKLGPQTFMQVNYPMTQKLYQSAIDHAVSKSSHERSWGLDLCCGVGTMTLALATKLNQVTGVEIVSESIASAQENADLNHINNAHFIVGDIKNVLPGLLKGKQKKHLSALIADPSRAGLGESCAALIGRIKGPCAVSLIFCSLSALQRDLPIVLKAGFTITKIQGFDMFPHSKHIETLVCLTKD